MGAPTGTPIYATAGGVVYYSQYNTGGYGEMVVLDHENGYFSRYAHCSQRFVSKGNRVKQGEKIAAVGSTGNSTGPHLHFEIFTKSGNKEIPQDPMPLLTGSITLEEVPILEATIHMTDTPEEIKAEWNSKRNHV